MFTQNCFIRIENDFSLIYKVSMMGYQPMFLDYKYNLMGKNLVLEHGTWHYTDSTNHPGAIDCGTNREMFLRFAAMNDENDKDQYFTGVEDPLHFVLCTTNTLREMFVYDKDLDLSNEDWNLYRKVTPQELLDLYTDLTSISLSFQSCTNWKE